VLASDGVIRWTGDAVAKLVAADDALHPRVRIISDERLTGAAREAVQTRLDLWLKTHIEKLLGPLFDLQKAEDVTGIARGIAFQLIEALGVIERSKIAAEMKDLDQASRASLRKYGVRFGAYHIYLPALLKPAVRALALLLWAQKQDNADLSALSSAQHLAGSGRTSFPVDKSLDRDAYRVLGYRQCGERAVRVDILERLADLIRPALSWREASPGTKPAGAFDGRGFVVTQAMTSLTGSAGEDFASVLRALGYRMEKRPPPPPKPAVVEVAAVETPVEAGSGGLTDDGAHVAPESESSAPSPTLLPDIAFAPASNDNEPPAVEAAAIEPVVEAAAAEPVVEAAAEPAAAVETPVIEALPQPEASSEGEAEAAPQAVVEGATEAVTEAVASETAATEAATIDAGAAPAAPEVAAVPELVEVWRPGGRSDERRPRHDRNRHRPQPRAGEGAAPAAAAVEPGEAAKGERHRRGRRDRNEFRKPRTDAPPADGTPAVAADGAPASPPREDRRPPRERFQGKGKDGDKGRDGDRPKGKFEGKFGGGRDKGGRDKGGRDRDKGGGRDSGPSHRQYATSAAPRERDRPVDPNSPFAKLAALKDQLSANRKD